MARGIRGDRQLRIDGLRWTLIATLGVACAGRSQSSEGGEAGGAGGSGAGSAGAPHGGSGGKGGSGATGGIGATGGSGATGGFTDAGRGASGGVSGGGGPLPTGGSSGDGAGVGGVGGDIAPGGSAGASSNPFPCESPTKWSENTEKCAGGFLHRAGATTCTLPPRDDVAASGAGGEGGAPGPAVPAPFGDCASDLDCGPNQYCIKSGGAGGEPVNEHCRDACGDDTDCALGSICVCETQTKADGVVVSFGVCVGAACTGDADCGDGLLCIADPSPRPCGTEPAFFSCQSPADQCAAGVNCADDEACIVMVGGVRACMDVGICGRPFLVDGSARRADWMPRADWLASGDAKPAPTNLPAAERDAVARHWLEVAAMEHASIAAFARFSLELLALGAPPELIEAATRAMADETQHARLAYGVAARYSERERGPAPLDVRGALAESGLLAVVERAVLEGCVGETGAALEAAWALDDATDPLVRAALVRIAEDETRHAALAFQFVAWAAERDARVPELVMRLLAQARAALAEPAPRTESSPREQRLAEHGVLASDARLDARRAALDEIVSVAARSLRLPAARSTRTARSVVAS